MDLLRPATTVNIVASTAFAVVPPDRRSNGLTAGAAFVASGGYRLTGANPSTTLTANPEYWAGPPAIGEIQLVRTRPDAAPSVFEAGDLDYAPTTKTTRRDRLRRA